jgi:hypothetical protein
MLIPNSALPKMRALIVLVFAGLAACGGGGGGGEAASATPAAATTPAASTTPAPSEPLTSYLARGAGGLGSATLNVGANGVFNSDATAYTLQDTGGTGCTLTASPSDSDMPVCNRFADGKAYLFCTNTSSRHFELVAFRQSDIQTGALSDVQGTTMAGLTCGSSGPRSTTDTLAFSADGSIAIETFSGGSTNTFGTGIPATLIGSPSGFQQTGSQHQRWAIYKVAAGGGTQVFLLDLWQADDAATPDHPVSMYFLQK